MRRIWLVALVLAGAMAVEAPGVQAAPSPTQAYIVVLRSGGADPGTVAEEGRRQGASVRHVYRSALRGYSASMSSAAADRLAADPRVAYVELDRPVTLVDTQTSAPYGLDRIDQRDLPLSGTYTYAGTGSGVTAYIIDTGIRFDHSQFGGRAVSGFDAIDGGSADDCNGHGTHVAGTVGGTTYGVAKAVSLVAVRVLGCTGSGLTSGVISGIDWITAHHTGSNPAVANMSLGGGASAALDSAVRTSVADGVTYAVAAGNGDAQGVAQDACGSSPARVAEALTVGATSSTDAKASFSNFGTCLDLFAPGVSIKSAWHTAATATATLNGTSMATPHVAGVAALYLQANPAAPSATVAAAINANATTGKLTSRGAGSPDRLLHSTFGDLPTPPPPPTVITLTATAGAKVDSKTPITLAWAGANGAVRITRNGKVIVASDSASPYTQSRRSGTYSYQVCETANLTRCSNTATITV